MEPHGLNKRSELAGSGAAGALATQGIAVAISADGNTAMLGGPGDSGEAWIFTRSSGTWSQQGAKLIGTGYAGNSFQGYSVSLSADGNTAIVGGRYDNNSIGASWIFVRNGKPPGHNKTKLVGTGYADSINVAVLQGYSISLSADGSTAITGGLNDNKFIGAAWIFVDSALSIPTPTITSFTPTSGPPNTLVTIIGSNLDSISKITIGDTGALVISDSAGVKIVGYVMPGAVTGPITITTAYGTATSASNFTVTPTPYPAVRSRVGSWCVRERHSAVTSAKVPRLLFLRTEILL